MKNISGTGKRAADSTAEDLHSALQCELSPGSSSTSSESAFFDTDLDEAISNDSSASSNDSNFSADSSLQADVATKAREESIMSLEKRIAVMQKEVAEDREKAANEQRPPNLKLAHTLARLQKALDFESGNKIGNNRYSVFASHSANGTSSQASSLPEASPHVFAPIASLHYHN